jgi:hypothetical protein
MEWLQPVCNIIIIVGGAIMAIKNVSEWFGKPIRLFKKKTDESFKEKVLEIIKEETPKLLNDEQYLSKIKQEILKEMQGELDQISHLAKQYEALAISAKDVLREKIMQIYFKNKKDKALTLHEKEALDQYYIDYKAIKGNSYIDKYYNRMKKWSIIEDEEDEDDAL